MTDSPASNVLLRTRNLTIRYDERVAVADVSLEMARGRITALIGPSGCGKTSVLSSLNRLIDLVPRSRVEGSIHLDSLDVLASTTDVVGLRRRVGMIFQKPNPLPLSIRDNLALPLKEHGVSSRDERDQRMETALTDVGLWEEVRERLGQSGLRLSGGQQQRLCIARALALRPEVLLFDEPCSALDPLSSAIVEDHIASLRGRYTVVIVTHNLGQARRLADDVACFWVSNGVGRVIETAPAEQLFDDPQHALTAAYVSGRTG